jgi:hypothetical protein
MMCDGLGVLSDLDFKRALLLYDRIYYLLPENTVRFPDITGKPTSILYPFSLYDRPEFTVHHFAPSDDQRRLLQGAAQADIEDAEYRQAIEPLSPPERLYTWRVVNCDGDLGGGESLALPPDRQLDAQPILLNKFLLAADAVHAVPLVGRPYVERLLSIKYRLGVAGIAAAAREGAVPLADRAARHDAVAKAVVLSLIPDEHIQARSHEEIVEFKTTNRDLFDRFSLTLRRLAAKVDALPSTSAFARELDELMATDVWEARRVLEDSLDQRWRGLFHGGVREASKADAFRPAVTTAITSLVLGILPRVTLGPLSVASAIAGVTAAAPWLVHATLQYLESRREVRHHGLFYLYRFAH